MEQAETDVTAHCSEESRTIAPGELGSDCSVAGNNKGPFDDPVYKELSYINGIINGLTKKQLTSKLAKLHLEIRGTKDILKKRLKAYYKEEKLRSTQANKQKSPNCPYKYLCVVDFEATCDFGTDYPHEIIEFPAILLDAAEKTIVAEFHEYCRPVLNSELSEFCTSLTGISQETVDSADTFQDVLIRFSRWLTSYGLGDCNSFAIVTDGSYDMGHFLVMQCNYANIPFPNFGKKWINIRKAFSNFYKTQRVSIPVMLENLGMGFEGRRHCGLDDARNIARIVIQMLKDGANVKINERLKWNSLPSKFGNDGYYKGAIPEGGDSPKVSCNDSDQLSKDISTLKIDNEIKSVDQAVSSVHELSLHSSS